MSYVYHLLVLISIYSMLAYSLNLLIGFGGLLSLCHAAFYGIGAYSFALLTTKAGVAFVPAVLLSVLLTAGIAFLCGVPALRFRGDLYVVATLASQMVIFSTLYNWDALTNGPYGLPGIARPKFGESVVRTPVDFLIFVIFAHLLVFSILFFVYRSPFGLALKALRDDERAAESLGISPYRSFLAAMTLAGGLAAIPGACFASYVTFIDPTSFTLRESIFVASILLVGGSGNWIGPIAGTLFMVLLPEGLRFVGFSGSVAANLREITYGTLLVLFMYWRPRGLAGEFKVE